jgi:glycosyltransferase involved in cell wall biosynthesis
MLISIVVPMYNAEKFIAATLESILRDKGTVIEVIVVNDKSTDHSLDRVREIQDERIRVIDGPGRGVSSAMNVGYAEARGSIIMCCDADDLFPTARISRQVQFLKSHPEYEGVCGIFSTIDSKGNFVAQMQCGDAPAEITDELVNGILRTSFCTYAIRSSLAQKVGGFREFFESAQDIDFQLRLGEAGRIAYVPENWYFYRLHASSITHTQSNAVRAFFERTAFELQRQRRMSGLDDLQRGCPPAIPSFGRSPGHSAAEHLQKHLLGRAWREHQVGKKIPALQTGVRALMANPLKFRVWKNVLALVFKKSGNDTP